VLFSLPVSLHCAVCSYSFLSVSDTVMIDDDNDDNIAARILCLVVDC